MNSARSWLLEVTKETTWQKPADFVPKETDDAVAAARQPGCSDRIFPSPDFP